MLSISEKLRFKGEKFKSLHDQIWFTNAIWGLYLHSNRWCKMSVETKWLKVHWAKLKKKNFKKLRSKIRKAGLKLLKTQGPRPSEFCLGLQDHLNREPTIFSQINIWYLGGVWMEQEAIFSKSYRCISDSVWVWLGFSSRNSARAFTNIKIFTWSYLCQKWSNVENYGTKW